MNQIHKETNCSKQIKFLDSTSLLTTPQRWAWRPHNLWKTSKQTNTQPKKHPNQSTPTGLFGVIRPSRIPEIPYWFAKMLFTRRQAVWSKCFCPWWRWFKKPFSHHHRCLGKASNNHVSASLSSNLTGVTHLRGHSRRSQSRFRVAALGRKRPSLE